MMTALWEHAAIQSGLCPIMVEGRMSDRVSSYLHDQRANRARMYAEGVQSFFQCVVDAGRWAFHDEVRRIGSATRELAEAVRDHGGCMDDVGPSLRDAVDRALHILDGKGNTR